MDRLARNAMLAKQANMSYGQWKALQSETPTEKPKEDVAPEGMRLCEECGKPFKARSNKRFCEYACRQKNWDRNRKRKWDLDKQKEEK